MVRDVEGKFVVVIMLSFRASSVTVAEAIVAHKCCLFAKQQGLKEIMLKSDSKETILCLQNFVENSSWEALPILRKLLNAKKWFLSCCWSWIPRLTNLAADFMASPKNAVMRDGIWVNRIPSSLVHILDKDRLPCPLVYKFC